jgi:tRNA G18 (ribose-2'-O)-methylase SpoU
LGPIVAVEDPADPRLADYIGLTDADLRRRVERDRRCFIAEGTLAVRALLRSRYPVRSVVGTAERLAVIEADLRTCAAPIYVASPEVLNATAGFRVHRGLVASGQRGEAADVASVIGGASLVLIVEDVNDHENMGALFRNARAFGAGAVVLSPRCCDPLYRRAVRVSLGHVLDEPFAVLSQWPDALGETVRAAGLTLIALTPSMDAVSIDDVPRDAAGRVAVMVGAEGSGLSDGALEAAHHRARIPMATGVDSVNVATAAAVALHAFASGIDS